MLVTLANIMKRSFRESDYISRWGGEEFLLLFPNTTEDEAKNLVEKLRIKVEEFVFANYNIHLTISAGIYSFSSEKNIDKNSLLKIVDDALYKAKENGRNQVVVGES